MTPHSETAATTYSWQIPELSGLDCFQASEMTHRYGRHSHPQWAIGIIEKGVGGNLYRGVRECVHPGEIVVMDPDEVHTGYPADGQPLSYRMFYISHSFFSDVLAIGSTFPRFAAMRITDSDWAARLRHVHCALAQPVGLREETLLIEVLTQLVNRYGSISAASRAGVEPAAISRTKEFLRQNFQRNVRIAELARLTGLDRAYLIRSFRRAVGMPPYEWLLQIRIEEAKKLLSAGWPIAQVSGEVSFADQSHMTRRFKSLTGLSPGQYVKGHYHSRNPRGPDGRLR